MKQVNWIDGKKNGEGEIVYSDGTKKLGKN